MIFSVSVSLCFFCSFFFQFLANKCVRRQQIARKRLHCHQIFSSNFSASEHFVFDIKYSTHDVVYDVIKFCAWELRCWQNKCQLKKILISNVRKEAIDRKSTKLSKRISTIYWKFCVVVWTTGYSYATADMTLSTPAVMCAPLSRSHARARDLNEANDWCPDDSPRGQEREGRLSAVHSAAYFCANDAVHN